MKDRRLDDALDALPPGGGTVTVDRGGNQATVDVIDADRLGVRVRGVQVARGRSIDVAAEAGALPERLRALPERVAPIEVAPELGGARLRTRPEELRGREWFEVDVEPDHTTIRRTKVDDDGTRRATDWTMTRDQLDRLIDEVG